MSRSGRRDLTTIIAVAITIAAALLIFSATKVLARTNVACWWEGSVLHASRLPDRPFAITLTPYPVGVSWTSDDGTFSLDFGWEPDTAYIWTRGGGGALFKPGRQLNDYHPICIAVR